MPLRNLPGATLCHFEKGDVLIEQDEKIEYLYYLVKGSVHRELLTPNGQEMILTIKSVDESEYIRSLIGVLVLYDQFEQYAVSDCTFIAKTECLCYRIPVASYREYEKSHETEIMHQLLHYVMDNYHALFEMYYTKQHKNSAAQICTIILEHAKQIDEHLVFDKEISNIELGKRLDIHPTTVSKILNVLVENGALRKQKGLGFVITDKAFIQAVADNKIEISYRHDRFEKKNA